MISRVLLVVLVCGVLTADLRGDSKAKSGAVAIRKAVAHKDRPENDRALDRNRKPAEVLRFFGIKPALDGESHLLRNPEDDRTINVFDERVRRKTDRFVLRFQKPKE